MKNMLVLALVGTLCFAASRPAFTQTGLKEVAVLEPSNAGASDSFGFSVSISGDVILAMGNGGECIFVKPKAGWKSMRETATLTTSDGSIPVLSAISGNTVAAAASNGSVYVFAEPITGWANMTETAKLTPSDGAYINSVAVQGGVIVAGSPSINSYQGAVYVFVEPAGGWVDMGETAKLTASDGAAEDSLGRSATISGSVIVAGAPGASTSDGEQQGAAYVYAEPAGGWVNATETGKLTGSDSSAFSGLGQSVAINENTIVVGAPNQVDTNNIIGGAAYIFVQPTGGWANMTQTAQLSPTNPVLNGSMGYSVSISGNLIVAGSPGAFGGSKRQAAYEFLKPPDGWENMTQTGIVGPNKAPGYAEFGYAVSSNGDTVVVGAPGSLYTNYEGLAYIFAPSR